MRIPQNLRGLCLMLALPFAGVAQERQPPTEPSGLVVQIKNPNSAAPSFLTVPPAKAKDVLDEYLIALRQHELGHFELAKDAAERIDAQIRTLPAMPTCKQLETAANERGNRQLEEVRRKEKQYDANTQHGKTQGAWLTQ